MTLPHLLDELEDDLVESKEEVRLRADGRAALVLEAGVVDRAVEEVVQNFQEPAQPDKTCDTGLCSKQGRICTSYILFSTQ